MARQVTEEEKRALREDGIVKLPGLVDAALLAELNTCFWWSVAHPGPIAVGNTEGDDILFVENANPEARPMYRDLVSGSPFGQVAADLWGSDYVGYYAEEVFWKRGRAVATFWHQDTVYSPWRGEHWGNFWIPLCEMDRDHAIRVVRASHLGVMYDGTTFNPKDPRVGVPSGGAFKLSPGHSGSESAARARPRVRDRGSLCGRRDARAPDGSAEDGATNLAIHLRRRPVALDRSATTLLVAAPRTRSRSGCRRSPRRWRRAGLRDQSPQALQGRFPIA